MQQALSLSVIPVWMDKFMRFVSTVSNNYNNILRPLCDVNTVTQSLAIQYQLLQLQTVDSNSTTSSSSYNQSYSSSSATATTSCTNVGHAIFFIDANQAVLGKVLLYPISSTGEEVFVPYSPITSLQDTTIYTSYYKQEDSELVYSDTSSSSSSNIVTTRDPPLTVWMLLKGLVGVQSITTDVESR